MNAIELNTQPIRVQRSRRHKQVSPNGYPVVYVGRPTKWGNPFKVEGKIKTAEEAVSLYRRNIMANESLFNQVQELRGKNLSCWCKPGNPCHADVLLEIANS